jgi:hypothetical protein
MIGCSIGNRKRFPVSDNRPDNGVNWTGNEVAIPCHPFEENATTLDGKVSTLVSVVSIGTN